MPSDNAIRVVSAKALVVGESGVGKTALARRLGQSSFVPTESTQGASLSRIVVPSMMLGAVANAGYAADLEVWDLAGQPDYNAIHQLYMPGTHVALIVIDESRENALDSVADWSRFVAARCPELQAKLLVSARIDRGGPSLDDDQIQACTSRLGLKAFVRTSAKTDHGIAQLREALLKSVDWQALPIRIMPRRWRAAEVFVQSLMSSEERVVGIEDIQRRFGSESPSTPELMALLQLMHQRGEIVLLQPRADSHFVLLDPSILSRYGSSVIMAARSNPVCPGSVSEADVLRGNLDFVGFDRLSVPEERVVLDAVVSSLLQADACTRDQGRLEFRSVAHRPLI
jgi:small GTP-binding protein